MERRPPNFNHGNSYPLDRAVFLDSSNPDEVRRWNHMGIIDGVTTNPKIMSQEGVRPEEFSSIVKEISRIMRGKTVSVEISQTTQSQEEMLEEAQRLNDIGDNIIIKVPLIPETSKSLEVIAGLASLSLRVNVTTLMTYEQMVIAALAARNCPPPSFISLFWGRAIEDHERYRRKAIPAEDEMLKLVGEESDVNSTPRRTMEEIAKFLREGGYHGVKTIAGSMRSAAMIGEAFAAGSNIVTVPPKFLIPMLYSKRTIETLVEFNDGWREIESRRKLLVLT